MEHRAAYAVNGTKARLQSKHGSDRRERHSALSSTTPCLRPMDHLSRSLADEVGVSFQLCFPLFEFKVLVQDDNRGADGFGPVLPRVVARAGVASAIG